jgi:hypothetical protein
VMMDAGFTNLDCYRNVGIAESGVSKVRDQNLGRLEDPVCRFTVHVYQTTN